MKNYTKLQIPKDSAWDRKTWRRYVHWRIREFIDSVESLIDWFPIIWKDRHWDDYNITKVLQRKIELQREYLIYHNRHMGLEIDNRDMTWVLNLIERRHEDYYALERYDYMDNDMVFKPSPDHPGFSEIEFVTHSENLDDYLAKYPSVVRKLKKQHPGIEKSKEKLSLEVGEYNQKRANDLLWGILRDRSSGWWD